MCFKWYWGTQINAVESAFGHPNFDLELLQYILNFRFSTESINSQRMGDFEMTEMAAVHMFFKWYCVMQIKAAEALFDCLNCIQIQTCTLKYSQYVLNFGPSTESINLLHIPCAVVGIGMMGDPYELIKIFSEGQITQKLAHKNTICTKLVACCVSKKPTENSSWKYCLDCQDSDFPDSSWEWSNYLSAWDNSLPAHLMSTMISRCSSNPDFLMPIFTHQGISDDHWVGQAIVGKDSSKTSQTANTTTHQFADHPIPPLPSPFNEQNVEPDITFSPYNNPVESPIPVEFNEDVEQVLNKGSLQDASV